MEKIWYYAESGQQVGPYSEREMQSLLENKKIGPTTAVWKTGMAEWLPVTQVAELSDTPTQTPAKPTPAPTASTEDAPRLKLGPARQYQKVNLKDEDPKGKVEVKDFMAANVPPPSTRKQAPSQQAAPSRPKDRSQIGFFESFGLNSFETAFFAVTLILGGITAAFMLPYWHAVVICLGMVWIFGAGLGLVIHAFQRHWIWGLVYLFVPFIGQLAYIIVDFGRAYKSLVLMLVGIAAVYATPMLPGFQQSPIFDHYEEYQQEMQKMIEQQQQEMEEKRNERLDEFEE